MKKQDFLDAVRKGGKRFRVDDVCVLTGSSELHGKGSVETTDDRFRICVTLDGSEPPPESPNGITLRKDFWTIRGVIEDEIHFITRDLPHNSGQSYNFGQPSRSTLEFSPNFIEFTPMGTDCMTSQEICELQRQLNQQVGSGVEAGSVDANDNDQTPENILVTFHAVLRNFELIDRNGGTETTRKNAFLGESGGSKLDTFHAEMLGWRYGLVERDGDLHVHLTSTSDYKSQGEDHDRRLFHAFLQALAFTHAQHAWPFIMKHRRAGKLVLERLHLHGDVADSPHAPFTERLAHSEQVRKSGWTFDKVLTAAYSFFSEESKLARECKDILYLMREATSHSVPQRIGILSLCSLLESLVRVIYLERIAPAKVAETEEFEKAKGQVCEQLRTREEPAYQRLLAILKPTEPVNIRIQFDAVIEHLALKPQEEWQALFGLWRKSRNPMSHRMSSGRESDESFKTDSIAESRISGAINCLILKLMNYSGFARRSAFEDKYGSI